jgi:Ca-activated chloride channel family protein
MKYYSYLVTGAIFFAAVIGLPNGETARAQTVSAAQTPKPTPTPTPLIDDDEPIKIDTELVNLNIRVVDRNNRPIANLQQSDFKVFEENIPQQIEFFSRSEVPTNYSLVLDNSGSLRSQLEKVIEAGKIIVNTNRENDQTSIIRFVSRDKITVEQPFTKVKADLTDALDNLFIEGGQTAIRDAVYLAAEQVDQLQKRATRDDERRRRALILVSDGEDRDSYYSEAQLFELLREVDVQIYVVGFVGELNRDSGFIRKSEQSRAKSFLERLATETGGRAYFPENVSQLSSIATEIAGEMRMQYSIGYIPSNDKTDGTYRSIKVQVTDGPGGQKRIPVTRAGRTATPTGAPTLQPANKPSN